MRVLFIHGLESSPKGLKATYLGEQFQALTPAMQTGDFLGCVAQQTEVIASFKPDVVVGSSFGGAVLLRLLDTGVWRGPTLLLAQAGYRYGVSKALPEGVPVVLVHGVHDDVIEVEGSRALAQTGTPELVKLVELDDDHRLLTLFDDDHLTQLVHQAFALANASAG